MKIKKILSVLLVLTMLLTCAVPAFAAGEKQDIPIVQIEGQGMGLYREDGSFAYPFQLDLMEYVKQVAPNCLLELSAALVTGNYSRYCDTLYEAIAAVFAEIRLNGDGEVPEGGPIVSDSHNANIPQKSSGYGVYDYVFHYDWRLDPCATADKLAVFIDRVREITGHDKVALIGRCLGSSIASAYLAKYGSDKIDTCVMYVPTANGTMMCGDTFAGKIELSPDSLDRFVNYYLSSDAPIEDADMNELLMALVSFFNATGVLSLGTDAAELFLKNIKDNLLPRLLLATYGGYPTYWSMVDDKHFDDALAYTFGGVEKEYAGMIEKIKNYHETVMVPLKQMLADMQKDGMKLAVVAKYGMTMLPLFKNSDIQSDGYVELSTLSFDATSCDITTKFSENYLAKAEANGTLKYISPDKQVDASTALVPDSTWFIKNITHKNFPDSIFDLILSIIQSKSQFTVWDDENYPQYMIYDKNTDGIAPLTEENDTSSSKWVGGFYQVLARFIMSILNFFKRIFGAAV